MLNELLAKYDKQLSCKKNLDGSVTIFRRSAFSTANFDVLAIKNQYIGSAKWVLKRIYLMDSRRQDFFVKSILNNDKLRKAKMDNRISRDIAEFIGNSGATFVN